jgi:hypothetical protein
VQVKALMGTLAVALGLSAGLSRQAEAAGYVTLSSSGKTVLSNCNSNNVASNTTCKVTSLPGESGFNLVASRSAPLTYNDVTIGTLYEKVWQSCLDKTLYIFGTRVIMNTSPYDSSGLAFNVNDLFRQTLPGKAVNVAYFLDGATKPLQKAGRTVEGLNEFDGAQPDRDNTWVDFRIDANASEFGGAKSPWVLAKIQAPKGYALNPLGIRVLNSDTADFFDAVDFFTTSYQPNGVPPPSDDGDDD